MGDMPESRPSPLPPTDGPWHVDGWGVYAEAASGRGDIGNDGGLICSICTGFDNSYTALANAQLIASAPDLEKENQALRDELVKAVNELLKAAPKCSCLEDFKTRGLTDPNCHHCSYQPEIGDLAEALKKATDND